MCLGFASLPETLELTLGTHCDLGHSDVKFQRQILNLRESTAQPPSVSLIEPWFKRHSACSWSLHLLS